MPLRAKMFMPILVDMVENQRTSNHIGMLNEKPLHAALKQRIARPGDRLETPVGGFVIDIVRDGLLIEIQTSNFSALKSKLPVLVSQYPLQLIYPIAREKWIVKPKGGGRRKSPRRGCIEDLFVELVSFPELMAHDNFSLRVLFIQEEVLRRQDGKRWRRGGWVTGERRLLDVIGQQLFQTPSDLAALLPPGLPEQFTTEDLAKELDKPRWLAQKMTYCLRGMGALESVGKRSRSILYSRTIV